MIKQHQLTEGRHLAWNSILSVATGLLVVGLNVIFVPLMLHAFGRELYGILSVTWMVLANFGWLDFGFSRASARYVAQELALGRPREAALWTWTAVISQIVLGCLGTLLVFELAPLIVDHIHIQQTDRYLVILTLRVFAFSIPLDFANRSITGILQAAQRFDWVNGLNIFSTLSMFAVYSAGILHRADFKLVVYGLLLLRIVNLVAVYFAAAWILPTLKQLPQLQILCRQYWPHAIAMVRYGSWIAVASVIGPLLLYFDQSMISVILGVAFLPFYTVPFNLLWRLFLFPSSLSSTLFPAFTVLEARSEGRRIERYFVRAHRYLLGVLLPALFFLYVWGPEVLRLWIGPEFASQGGAALRILSFGFGIGLLAPISGALLEAVGRPDLLVKLYMIELPFNTATVWFLTSKYGIPGAAFSYTLRSFVETISVWFILYRVVHFSWRQLIGSGLLRPSISLFVLGMGVHLLREPHVENYFSIIGTFVTLIAYAACLPILVFDANDRYALVNLIKSHKFGDLWRRSRLFVPSADETAS